MTDKQGSPVKPAAAVTLDNYYTNFLMDSFLLDFRTRIIPGAVPVAGQTAFTTVVYSNMPENFECDKGRSKLRLPIPTR